MTEDTSYARFLARKQRTVAPAGCAVDEADVHPMLHPWQKRIVTWAAKTGRAAVWADTGTGKALDSDTSVVTPTGLRRIGDLSPGEYVIGANGQPTEVLGVYPQGTRPACKIRFSDDASVICDDEHLWAVRTKVQKYRKQGWQVKTLRELREIGIGEPSANGNGRWFIPMVEPVEFREAELPLHPYLLGCLIGDGCIKYESVMISSADEDLIEHLREILPLGTGIEKQRYSRYDYKFVHVGRWAGKQGHHKTPVRIALEELGLQGHGAESKFIPDCYKYAAADTRLALLQGLMDTDGSVWDSSGYSAMEYTTVSPRLAEDYLFLVQSLGGKGRIRTKQTTGRLAYRVAPSFPAGLVPFLVKRKADLFRPRAKYMPARSIRSVESAGERDMTCIRVAAADGLFVTEGFVVTHNTVMQLQWAALSGQRSLVVAPLAVCRQTVREAGRVDLEARYVRSDATAVGPGVWVTNYEMVQHFDPSGFDAVVLDESSILKQADGKTRTMLIRHFRDVKHRLSCSATPAPNDNEELTSQAEFLGIMPRVEMLAAYFVHDDEGWRIKGHARRPMFRWMATWAVALRRPSDIGGDDTGYILPGLDIIPHLLPVDATPEGQLFATSLGGVGGRAKVRKATLGARCEKTAELIAAEPDEPWIAWCGLNDEADRIAKMIPGAVNVHGTMSPEEKAEALLGFADGGIRVIVTKPSIASFGMNWQHCARMVFCGLGDSYEQYYQAIRRCHRYGQTRRVHAHVVLSEIEAQIAENVARKEKQATATTEELVREMRAAGELRLP